MEKVRLNKFLRNCGIGSRRKVEELILGGRVSINSTIVKELGTLVDTTDLVCLNGKKVSAIETFVYYMLNKPKEFLCSHKRYGDEKIVYDLLPKSPPLFSIGRLDKDTTGLLLFTNDGDFANKVIHPSSNITKEYVATTEEELTLSHLKQISKGTFVEEIFIRPVQVEKLSPFSVKIVVQEGKKREVRILVSDSGLTLLNLTRIKIGGLNLGNLREGEFIPLTEKERMQIFQ